MFAITQEYLYERRQLRKLRSHEKLIATIVRAVRQSKLFEGRQINGKWGWFVGRFFIGVVRLRKS